MTDIKYTTTTFSFNPKTGWDVSFEETKRINKEDIDYILSEFNKIFKEKLKNCNHSQDINKLNPYHLEGDCYTHTLMVANEALKKDDFIGFIIGLLHDIGKPESILDKDNKRFFSGHEGISTYKSISFLNKLLNKNLIKYSEREFILKVINYHSFLYKKLNKLEEYFKWDKNLMNYLVKFREYDRGGSMYIREPYSSKDTDFEIAIDYVNKVYTKQPEIKVNKPTIYVLVGIPLSGKTTYIKENFDLNKFVVINRDDELFEYGKKKYNISNYNEIWKTLDKEDQQKINKRVMDKFISASKEKKDIIIDMTNMSRKTRKKWWRSEYNYEFIVFLTDYNIIKERNIERNKKEGKFIPEKEVINMMKRFEIPLISEYKGYIKDITFVYNNEKN